MGWRDGSRHLGGGCRHGCGSKRKGITVLELLVVCTIIGGLYAIALPAIGAARESCHRLQCSGNLHQIGIALSSYHELHGWLPPGSIERGSPAPGWGWASLLLRELDQRALHNALCFEQPMYAPVNEAGRLERLPVFLCSSDPVLDRFTMYRGADSERGASPASPAGAAAPPELALSSSEGRGRGEREPLVEVAGASYVAVFGTIDPDTAAPGRGDGPFVDDRAVCFAELRRGLSNTFLVGERTAQQFPSTWVGFHPESEDARGRVVGYVDLPPNHPQADECEFSSRHPGGAQFLVADGRVVFVAESIERAVYRRCASRHGGF